MQNPDTAQPHFPKRRQVLTAVAAGGAAALVAPRFAAAAAPTVRPPSAAIYPKAAFLRRSEEGALKSLYGMSTASSSTEVKVDAPEIVVNGAEVPVAVDANLPDITGVAVLAILNPYTLACAYKLPPGTGPAISSRIKLAQTTTVVAVVQSGGALSSASKQVKTTLGGCG
ncbi:MAG: thiosulfate oxidation carrier protein SoxY [Acidiphilium sp.]|nr:thiosulfate oxidation carrier protein SoxY [Acidiphilium sp.]MDD4936078.1 thiosulfate oxidation carrier protein SoxY [Acidiphilium sp.]